MAALPSYVTVLLSGLGEEFKPEVISSPMERGVSKHRLGNTRVIIDVASTLLFVQRADTVSFDDWYHDTIKRIGWFDWFDARHQITRSARFKGGELGRLTATTGSYGIASRAATLEYLR